MTRTRLRTGTGLAALVLVASCGSTPTQSDRAGAEPTPETSDPEAGGYGAEQPQGGSGDMAPGSVKVVDYAFTPAEVRVGVGQSVTWTFADEAGHDVTAKDQTFVSEVLGSGGTYSFTFPRAGSFDYFCSIHPTMKGTVVVQ